MLLSYRKNISQASTPTETAIWWLSLIHIYEYYLNHLYDGTYNKVGCLFADYENQADFSDRNTIVYEMCIRDRYVTIESGQTSSVHFSNILKKFRVHVVKSDVDTGNAQGDATLAGATYGIFRDGELIDTYTTGSDGSFMGSSRRWR